MKSLHQPTIVKAAQQETTLSAALVYAALGLSIIPLDGKRPALTTWTEYQQTAASPETIRAWDSAGLMKNIGIICGRVSGNLVVLDLDGAAGYPAFAATFPALAETYTIASGGGVGRHVYFYADPSLPPDVGLHRVLRSALQCRQDAPLQPLRWCEHTDFEVAVVCLEALDE